jgi:geranylgeranyl diphosphate synthase type II
MERALTARLPEAHTAPARLHEAMRYCVLDGGLRLGPVFLFAAARAVGVREDDVEAAACALELMHAYSLVHEGLLRVNAEDRRRLRRPCHEAYDAATAILVGDALPPLAFQLLALDPALTAEPTVRLRLIDLLAQASGVAAAGGDNLLVLDCGALIRAGVLMAAECAPSIDAHHHAALTHFAAAIGLLHPPVTAKTTAPERKRALHDEASEALRPLGDRAALLHGLADWSLTRL